MDGELITSGEQRQALAFAETLDGVISEFDELEGDITPIRDFLIELAWKGSH
jgi:hypothetical protein